jgi:hypothetical protein
LQGRKITEKRERGETVSLHCRSDIPGSAMGVQGDPHAHGRWLRGLAQKYLRDRQEDICEKRELRKNKTLQWSEVQNWGERGELVG